MVNPSNNLPLWTQLYPLERCSIVVLGGPFSHISFTGTEKVFSFFLSLFLSSFLPLFLSFPFYSIFFFFFWLSVPRTGYTDYALSVLSRVWLPIAQLSFDGDPAIAELN